MDGIIDYLFRGTISDWFLKRLLLSSSSPFPLGYILGDPCQGFVRIIDY